MRTEKVRIVLLATCILFVGTGLALSYRKLANTTRAVELERPRRVIEDRQGLKSQGIRFAETDGLEFERRVIKGAPFSAVVVIEVTQTNSENATTNSRKAFSLIYRDQQGRTRRDQMPSDTSDAPLSAQAPLLTTINDPVAGYTYSLNSRANIARRSAFTGQSAQDSNSLTIRNQPSVSPVGGRGSAQTLPVPATADAKQKLSVESSTQSSSATRELLGQLEIEGFIVEGTRVTMTIPAGAIGNDQPMSTSVDRWYSPELKAALLIERTDPRFGTITWRLSRIKRGDPVPEQFTVPPSFKIIPN